MIGAELRTIAVLRALHLGDLLNSIPALRALRCRWPAARVTLLGLPGARHVAERFGGYIDDFVEMPAFPGLTAGVHAPNGALEFLREMQQRRFDLALQLTDNREISNSFVALLGARRSAGYYRDGEWCPDAASYMPWRDDEADSERCLRLLATLGAAARGTELEAPLTGADRHELMAVPAARDLARGQYVCIHPGARLPSRRWYPERFALVADELAARGFRIAVTGLKGEAAHARRMVQRMHGPAIDLVGRTTLGALTALIDGARLVVANDTGVRQIASARATPFVGVACGGDVRRSQRQGELERLLFADLPCQPCNHVRCPIGHACAHGVEPREVLAAANALLTSAATATARASYAA
jgi:ADP-heptose:LPS heptosyltransferase